jgi:hypothetical protein
MKMYLSGKVDARKWDLVVPFKHLCEFFASDGGCATHGPHGWKGGFIVGTECWRQCNDGKPFVEKMVLDPIRSCDALIAHLVSNDSYGSIAEIAFASAIGKTCHMIVEEHRTDGDYCPLHDAYWFVGSLPNVHVHLAQNGKESTDRLVEILESLGVCMTSYVYFIEALGKNEVKIGSSSNPEHRVAGLQTGNASQFKLLGTLRGGRELEHEIHRKFNHLRIRQDGEWFYGFDELRDYIAKNCAA